MKNNNILDDNDYTVSEAANFMEVTVQTVSKYLRNGELKGIKKGPKKKWFVKGIEIKKQLEKWKLL